MGSYKTPTGRDFLPNITKRKLASMRKKETNERYQLHLDAAIMRKDSHTIADIAEVVGVSPATVINWLGRMVERGGVGRGYTARRGRPRAFTLEQLKELEKDMKRSSPKHHGLASKTWTSKAVSEHARNKFGIDIPDPSMRRILTRDGIDWPGSAAATGKYGRG